MAIYNLRYITESKIDEMVGKASSKIIIFYSHCIKWISQPSRQGSSWIDTIVKMSSQIYEDIYDRNTKKINKNAINILNNHLSEYYQESIILAKDEMKSNVADINEGDIFATFSSVENIINIDLVYKWLLDNAENTEWNDVDATIDKKKNKKN